MQHNLLPILFAVSMLAGCATKPEPEPEVVGASEIERRAYAEGARQAFLDFAGKLRAQQRFVYEPSVVTCGVRVPGRVANGSYIPPHDDCVVESRGRFTEQAPVVLPEIGAGQ